MTDILIIEDDNQILENLVEVLSINGHRVEGLDNGDDAIAALNEKSYDLILCDIMMTPTDGYTVLIHARTSTFNKLTQFVFITAKDTRHDQRKGMSLGADDYLTKPFSLDELHQTIAGRLRSGKLRAQAYERQLEAIQENLLRALPHELRTPLTGIIGYTSILEDDLDILEKDDIRVMVSGIMRASNRLARLIENHIVYAELSIITNRPDLIDAYRATEAQDLSATGLAKAQNAAWKYSRDADLQTDFEYVPLRIDSDHFGRLISELTDNACKFSIPKTPIHIVGQANEAGFDLSVHNVGRGMHAEEINDVGAYKQFNRRLHEQQGSGLGLAIVKRITEIYDATFTIESIPDEAITVRVRFPESVLG